MGGKGQLPPSPLPPNHQKKKNFWQGRKKFSLYITYSSGRLNLLLQKWIMFIYRRLTSCFKSISENCIYRSTVDKKLFYLVLWSKLAGRSAQTYEKWSFFVFLVVWILFPKFLGRLKEWLMLELHKIIRLTHRVACPIVFILFYERGWQGGVLKVMKNDHFLGFLAVWVLSPKFLGSWRSNLW